MIIRLSGSAAPTDQIRDQLRGLIAAGHLAAHDRLPSVRQLAKDLGVAPGTVAKAYRALEAEGLLIASTGGGTRVSETATTTPRAVLDAAHVLARGSKPFRTAVSADSADGAFASLRRVFDSEPAGA